MGYLISVLSGLSFVRKRDDDDLVDRLHYFLTTNLLVCLSVLVSWKQFGGKPIECVCPTEFPHGWEQYAESFCWAQDTYYIPLDEEVPPARARVPFFLLLQAVSFSVPAWLWDVSSGASGLKVGSLVKSAKDPNNIRPDIRSHTVKIVTNHVASALRFQRRLDRKHLRPHQIFRCLNLPFTGHHVALCYLVAKLLYLANVVGQFFLLNSFLMTQRYSFYGWDALRDLLRGARWDQSGNFPRITLCDVEVRMVSQVPTTTVQCTLSINLFNEKIFICLWFWYCAIAVMTALSFFYWVFLLVGPYQAEWFVSRNLELSEMSFDPKLREKEVRKFVTGYLKSDGIFVCRMVTIHSGVIMGTEVVLGLWRSFYGIEAKIHNHESDDSTDSEGKKTGNETSAAPIKLRSIAKWKEKESIEEKA